MAIACIWGKSVDYQDLGKNVLIETNDGRVIVIKKNTFEFLYYRLNDFTAALKEDCIDYAVYSIDTPICQYPDWFIDSVHQGFIFVTDDISTYIDEYGEIELSPDYVVLKNFKGELKCMESNKFHTYYDTLEECI